MLRKYHIPLNKMYLIPISLYRDLRQVPDTQEVFLYPGSSVSIIVEILERVEPSHFDDAIRLVLNINLHFTENNLNQQVSL